MMITKNLKISLVTIGLTWALAGCGDSGTATPSTNGGNKQNDSSAGQKTPATPAPVVQKSALTGDYLASGETNCSASEADIKLQIDQDDSWKLSVEDNSIVQVQKNKKGLLGCVYSITSKISAFSSDSISFSIQDRKASSVGAANACNGLAGMGVATTLSDAEKKVVYTFKYSLTNSVLKLVNAGNCIYFIKQ